MRITDAEQANVIFQRTIELLREPEAAFTAEAIYSLSDMHGEHLDQFQQVWPTMAADRRLTLVQRLVETAETNFELDFTAVISAALDDPDREVRLAAVEGVLEEHPHRIVEQVIKLAQDDLSVEVRAAAAQALGQFVLLGELGKLPDTLNERLQDTALVLHRNPHEDREVRRRALEALGNCSREGVAELIRAAYYADDLLMRVSAVFAMGRSYDEVWIPIVMDELSSDEPQMRYEAARAAGELEIRPALPRLVELAYDDDREIQEIAIWALGEIGGQTVDRVLAELAALADTNSDAELAEAVAEAQSAATLSGEELLPLFDFSDYDEEMVDELDGHYLYGNEYDDEDDEEDEDLDDVYGDIDDFDELDELDEISGFDYDDMA